MKKVIAYGGFKHFLFKIFQSKTDIKEKGKKLHIDLFTEEVYGRRVFSENDYYQTLSSPHIFDHQMFEMSDGVKWNVKFPQKFYNLLYLAQDIMKIKNTNDKGLRMVKND